MPRGQNGRKDRMTALDNLKKTAKRWLKALRANNPDAIARLRRALPDAPAQPCLRVVQHAVAHERGFNDWYSLVRAHQQSTMDAPSAIVRELLAAYETGEPTALARLSNRYGTPVTTEQLREGVRRRLAPISPREESETGVLTPQQARLLVAREYGFRDWHELEEGTARPGGPSTLLDDAHTAPLDVSTPMIQPVEIRAGLPVRLHDGTMSDTVAVWSMLTACRNGDLDRVAQHLAACPSLVRCDYNYMPPLHLAVREGHGALVRLLIERRAANPNYVTYPYRERLIVLARDRGEDAIASMLEEAYRRGDHSTPEDEAGEIIYSFDEVQRRFQKLLNTEALGEVGLLLKQRPALAQNPLAFWGEGVLMMPAKLGHVRMIELLTSYGARVPDVSKWGAWYYLWQYDVAAQLLDGGMDPDHMNCHHTTVLHDMAYKGDARKAALLLDHGADVNAIDEEFQSTPLGLAARWGNRGMAALLIERGADPNAAGKSWATPIEWAKKKGHADLEADLRRLGARD
jgi:ankyrin repeat protein